MKNKTILVTIATLMLAISAATQLNAQQPDAPPPPPPPPPAATTETDSAKTNNSADAGKTEDLLDFSRFGVNYHSTQSSEPEKNTTIAPTPAMTEKDSAKTNNNADAGKTEDLLDFSRFNFNYDFSKSSDAQSGAPDKTITIGTQTWMAENLNVSNFRNGDPIPEVTTTEEWVTAGKSGKPAWCYYNNDPANEKKYGKLYNWFALTDPRGLAPTGWHVPSLEEWTLLLSYLGRDAGRKMRTAGDWKSANDNGTNESGFSALPGNCRFGDGDFFESNSSDGYWWSSTEFLTTHTGYGFNIEYYGPVSKHLYDDDGLSVRCVKD
jgi:uncharacterized protein (TIGR02145 family)